MIAKEHTAIAIAVPAAEDVYSETQPCLEVEAPATLPEASDERRRCSVGSTRRPTCS